MAETFHIAFASLSKISFPGAAGWLSQLERNVHNTRVAGSIPAQASVSCALRN